MRTRLKSPSVFKKGKPSWKVTDAKAPKQKAWEVSNDSKGITTFTELNPPMLSPITESNKHARSRFKLEITDECLVAGHPASIGDIVECYSISAGLLRERTRILEEEMNAF